MGVSVVLERGGHHFPLRFLHYPVFLKIREGAESITRFWSHNPDSGKIEVRPAPLPNDIIRVFGAKIAIDAATIRPRKVEPAPAPQPQPPGEPRPASPWTAEQFARIRSGGNRENIGLFLPW